jgi:hypothetical protein
VKIRESVAKAFRVGNGQNRRQFQATRGQFLIPIMPISGPAPACRGGAQHQTGLIFIF